MTAFLDGNAGQEARISGHQHLQAHVLSTAKNMPRACRQIAIEAKKKAETKIATPVGLEPTIFATGKQRLTIRPRCQLIYSEELDESFAKYE